MEQGVEETNYDWRFHLMRSKGHGLRRARTAIRHQLIDAAVRTQDNELWLALGLALIAARKKDDLSSELSDRFVDACPSYAFLQIVEQAGKLPNLKAWRDRYKGLQKRRGYR